MHYELCIIYYTGPHSLQIRTQVFKLCFSAFPQLYLRFISQLGRRLSTFVPFKNHISMLLRSCIVCKYTCQCSSVLYLGQTQHHLHTWISEHMGVSSLTRRKLASISPSGVHAHCQQTSIIISPDDFSIIFSCRTSCRTSKLKPTPNENISSIPLSLF